MIARDSWESATSSFLKSFEHPTVARIGWLLMSPVNGLQINLVINSIKDNFWHSAGKRSTPCKSGSYLLHEIIYRFEVAKCFARECRTQILLHNCDSRNSLRDMSELMSFSIKLVLLLLNTSYTEYFYLHNNDAMSSGLSLMKFLSWYEFMISHFRTNKWLNKEVNENEQNKFEIKFF